MGLLVSVSAGAANAAHRHSAQKGRPIQVAQIFNLLYRRILFCCASTSTAIIELSDTLQIENLRYSRLKICATLKTIRRADTNRSGLPALLFMPALIVQRR